MINVIIAREFFLNGTTSHKNWLKGIKGFCLIYDTGLPSAERDNWEARAKAHTHWTPFAHCSFSIRVTVPFFLARQLHKHTVGLVINDKSCTSRVTLPCGFQTLCIKHQNTQSKEASDEKHTVSAAFGCTAKRNYWKYVKGFYTSILWPLDAEKIRRVALSSYMQWLRGFGQAQLLAFNRV